MNRAWSIWSIGILKGESPFDLLAPSGIENPVLCGRDVSDTTADFVADPFMVREKETWHMFFEVKNSETGKGEIGLATSRDALHWSYRQIVLDEPFHLSYPYVFKWEGEYYMLPETLPLNAIQLYRADSFPLRWSHAATLIEVRGADPSVFRFADKWWMFVCTAPDLHDRLALYFADELKGPWREHPKSPIVSSDARRARPAGRVLVFNDRLIRFAQDCHPRYGSAVRAFEIKELTTADYTEEEIAASPILKGSRGAGEQGSRGDMEPAPQHGTAVGVPTTPAAQHVWNLRGMHHIDAHPAPDGGWIACVDGFHLSDD
ncbi:MAG: hypothetical protein L0229_28865 [Blastocatellia bacterium]|nr:hypothetical protein [Blastocatellia bacterium]